MLAVNYKVSASSIETQIKRPLIDFLTQQYGASTCSLPPTNDKALLSRSLSHTQNYALERFISLKHKVDSVQIATIASKAQLIDYYLQLSSFSHRFLSSTAPPVFPTPFAFTWFDSFMPRVKVSECDTNGFIFEKIALLFNIGALDSQLGVKADRSTTTGLKQACYHFTAAAGCFSHIREHVIPRVSFELTSDCASESLGLLHQLMLAQAQACYYEKAIKDALPDSIKAKLAHQSAEYHEKALGFSQSSNLAVKLDRMWMTYLHYQVLTMKSATQYWQSRAIKQNALKKGTGYGEEITRLKLAHQFGKEAIAHADQIRPPPGLYQPIRSLLNTIHDAIQSAEKDNANVYLERVPPESELGPVGKVSMVKSIPMDEEYLRHARYVNETGDLVEVEQDWNDVFAVFVPKELLNAEMEIRNELQDLVKKTSLVVSSWTDAIKQRLNALGLPASIEAFQSKSACGLPSKIWQKISHIQHTLQSYRSPCDFFEIRLQKNIRMLQEAQDKLKQAEMRLNQEESDDNTCRLNYGAIIWTRPTSRELNRTLKDEITRFSRLVAQGGKSDHLVESKLHASLKFMERLMLPKATLDAQLEALQGEVSDDSDCDSVFTQLSALLLDLNRLINDHENLMDRFRKGVDTVDILAKLTVETITTVKESELVHFKQAFVDPIQACKEREEELVEEVKRLNQEFQNRKSTNAAAVETQAFMQRLNDGIEMFEQLESHVNEGETFYQRLLTRFNELIQMIQDYCEARDLERKDLELHIRHSQMLEKDANFADELSRMSVQVDELDQIARDEAMARELAALTANPNHSTSITHRPPQWESRPPAAYNLFGDPNQFHQQQRNQYPGYSAYPGSYPTLYDASGSSNSSV
uniref:Programmed cell death 6interacting protein putative n=1 Tax=Albugo laibachii Nc14 TaxID=890382 RepID=F0WIG2_9STRA|nr:programmed cell death 6interacting protein putative [Albugo laibachii Nc14]|eukprot:CCA21044.1 programmed cell death 6interacting protein putative [Albugo laibachii Nc14]